MNWTHLFDPSKNIPHGVVALSSPQKYLIPCLHGYASRNCAVVFHGQTSWPLTSPTTSPISPLTHDSHLSTSPLKNTLTFTLTLTLTLTSTRPLALNLNPTPPLTLTKPLTLTCNLILIPTITLTLTVSEPLKSCNVTKTSLKPKKISYVCAGLGPQTFRKDNKQNDRDKDAK